MTALVCLVVWYWLKAREMKEWALRLATQHCRELDLELLDQTVVLKKLKPFKMANGSWCIAREYQFDFSSSGDDRYKGRIRLLGRRLDGVTLAPHRVQ